MDEKVNLYEFTPVVSLQKNSSFACPPLAEPLHSQANAFGIAEVK
jgi:hypothetical protein